MLRVFLAKTFHWTLDYIDSLSPVEIVRINAILDGQAKYDKKISDLRSKGLEV